MKTTNGYSNLKKTQKGDLTLERNRHQSVHHDQSHNSVTNEFFLFRLDLMSHNKNSFVRESSRVILALTALFLVILLTSGTEKKIVVKNKKKK